LIDTIKTSARPSTSWSSRHAAGRYCAQGRKERRVDPQVTVGLLTTADGFPVEVDLFAGNKAETKTLIPVLSRFRDRYQARDLVVVAAERTRWGDVIRDANISLKE